MIDGRTDRQIDIPLVLLKLWLIQAVMVWVSLGYFPISPKVGESLWGSEIKGGSPPPACLPFPNSLLFLLMSFCLKNTECLYLLKEPL